MEDCLTLRNSRSAQNSLDVSVRFGYPNFIGVANPIYSASAGTAYYALKEKRTSQIELTSSAPKEEVKVYEEEYEEIDEQRRGGFIEKIKDFFADFF